MTKKELDTLSVATLRSLCIDTINKANSGHPGMALGSAPIVYTLFKNHLVSDPKHSTWINRDRFILSAGHASALLYSTLHLFGYKVSLDDLKSFRQLGSLTPGHPEYKHTEGVDATSGPLGQGIAQAVGVAMAERMMAAQYKDGESLINHYTYCLCGDGCLQEGISQEAISLAGHQKLNKLILIYDSNEVTLDGGLGLSFSEQTKLRFKASNWDVLEVNDGNDLAKINKAIIKAKKSIEKPTLIIVHTVIGYGSAKQGTSKVHGSPLGVEDGKNAKLSYGFDHEDFFIPEEVYKHLRALKRRGSKAYKEWNKTFAQYKLSHKEGAARFELALKGDVSSLVYQELPNLEEGSQEASRATNGKIINLLHEKIPFLVGGSADVAGSVMTKVTNGVDFTKETPYGRNINFGIREFEMASAQNGMLLHGGLKTYVGCFLVFSDYMKSAIRTSALSKLPAIYLFSHDSIALGEDGPTHQPIEHLAMLRSIPNVDVIRPADARETYAAWKLALLSKETPTCLILSRQNLPLLSGSNYEGVSRGAYVISKEEKKPELVFIATGSEVSLAIAAQKTLKEEGVDVRVVSMPSTYLFDNQKESYKKEVLCLPKAKTIAVEMLSTFGWYKYADTVMGIDTFGTSAPAKDAIKHFDFTSEHLVALAKKVLGK